MSPTMATFRPAMRAQPLADGEDVQQALRGVLVLAVAGVDDASARRCRASMCGGPDWLWRMTKMSTPIASMLRTVSSVVSPLATEEPLAVNSSTSADSRWAASSKLIRVRVESSKNSS